MTGTFNWFSEGAWEQWRDTLHHQATLISWHWAQVDDEKKRASTASDVMMIPNLPMIDGWTGRDG